MILFRLAVLVLLSSVLAACGGGGGSGGGSKSFRVTVDRTSLTFDTTPGGNRPTEIINATTTGTVPDPLYVGAIVEGSGIDPNIQIVVASNNSARIHVQPAFGLAVGDYSGRILFLACTDQACNNRVGGTPIGLTYVVRVRPPAGISPSRITMSATEGNPATASVTVRMPDDSAFTATLVDSPEWLTISNLTATGLQLTARPLPSGPPAGSYSAVLRVQSGSQSYQADVSLSVNPLTPLALSAVSGQPASGETVALLAPDASTYIAAVNSGDEWLSITEQLPGVIRVQARSLPAGQYSGSMVITSGSVTTYRGVSYTVAEPPGGYRGMSLQPQNLTLTAAEGATGPVAQLSVVKPSWNPPLQTDLDYYHGPTDWVKVTETSDGYDISADASLLTRGSYSAMLTINPGWPSFAVGSVPIALTVGSGLVKPADVNHAVTAKTTLAELSGSVPIDVVAGPVANWTATDDANWLTLTRASGATGTALEYRIDPSALATLANFNQYQANITITPDNTVLTPVSFRITLDRQIAEVTSLGPFYLVANQPNRLIIRGGRFQSLDDVATDVGIAGVAGATLTVVNDTEIIADLGPLASGKYEVSIDNALGLPTRSPSFTVVAPRTHAYATAQTGGTMKTVVYDAARDYIFTVNDSLQSLQRFRHSSGNWVVQSVPVTQILNAALVDSGDYLMVTSADGTIRLIDPETLEVRKTWSREFWSLPSFFHGDNIPVTNDGHAFLPTGTSLGFSYFDYVTESFGEARVTMYLSGEPRYAISRNGERLLLGSGGNYPPMYYMDAKDGQVRRNPAGLDAFVEATLNDDGSRFVLGNFATAGIVYDNEFQIIGNLPDAPSGYRVLTRLLSPDGARTYVPVINSSDNGPLPPAHPLRVYVFDSSTRLVNQQYLPALGYFEVSHHPECRSYSDPSCKPWIVTAISPDGRTLFLAGTDQVVIVPVPDVSDFIDAPVSSGSSSVETRVQKTGGSFMVKPRRWQTAH